MLLADPSSIAQRHPIHHEHVNCRAGSFVNCHQCTAAGAAWLLPERVVEWDDGGEGAIDESARSLSPSGGVTPLMAFFASFGIFTRRTARAHCWRILSRGRKGEDYFVPLYRQLLS